MILQFEKQNQELPTPVPRLRTEDLESETLYGTEGKCQCGLDKRKCYLAIAPDEASGLSGVLGK